VFITCGSYVSEGVNIFTCVVLETLLLSFPFQVLKTVHTIGNIKRREQFSTVLAFIKNVTESILLPSFQDVTNMFSNGATFFVDGNSLVLNLMGNENYDANNGGQLLHLIYLCERHLQIFSRKGGKFEVVFFNIWNEAWSGKNTLLLARSALMSHLKFNMSCKVHEFESMWDVKFGKTLEKCNCAFILFDFQMLGKYTRLFPNENHMLEELIFHVSIFYYLVGLNVACVDMNDVQLTVSMLNAFCFSPRVKLGHIRVRQLLDNIIQKIEERCKPSFISSEAVASPLICLEGERDVRRVITVSAATLFLKDSCAPQPQEDWIRAFLLYSSLLEVLPLKLRGCTSFGTSSTTFTQFLKQLHKHMNCVLQAILHDRQTVNYSFDTVSDLWHGNLFVFVLNYVTDYETPKEIPLGKQTLTAYDKLLQEVVKFAGKPLIKFPITKQKLKCYQNKKTKKKGTVTPSFPSQCLNHLIPTNCLLINEFCKDILPKQEGIERSEVLTDYVIKNSNFKEKQYWHSRKPITDHIGHMENVNFRQPTDEYQMKENNRMRNKYAHYMFLYGSSIEGRPLATKSIVCENVSSHEKKIAKPERISKNAQKIMDESRRAKQAKDEESDRQIFNSFIVKYKEFKKRIAYEEALCEVKHMENILKTKCVLQRVLMHKAKILWRLWQDECKTVYVISNRNLNYAKEIFLLVRRLLKEFENISLSDQHAKRIGGVLWQMGLERIAQSWNLPRPSRNSTDQPYSIGMSWIDFQLLHLGPELERELGSTPDNRVEGFMPDKWQRELFDIVDRHQSVLVVAATSSGKTYASYYCMEKVLRESNDGVLVYVAPTKALVNQVAATIYARFKNKRMPNGKSVYGVFTRDYRINALNSQILVTVPECFELLLLSSHRYDWVRSLRYVIFDEIHCLAGQAGGFAWESSLLLIRCPFLALSATVEDPEFLHTWLQNMQDFKKVQDITNGCEKPHDFYRVNLVVYRDRHADLRKLVYCKGGRLGQLCHVHPYAYLDEALIRKKGRIPQHISLSPAEVHDLYIAMKSVSPKDPHFSELHPEFFFSTCTSGFISRNMVRDFEAELKKLLEKWAFEDCTALKTVLAQLKTMSSSAGNVSERRFIDENFIEFVLKLQKENMLPAIAFSYDRSLVNYLFSKTTKYYKDCAKQYEAQKKVSSQTKSSIKTNERSREPKSFANRTEGDFVVSRVVHGRNKYEASLHLLHSGSGKFTGLKNVVFQDRKIVQFVENRLMHVGYRHNHEFPCGLRNGLGKHYGGMNAKERSAVEMLFRMRMLNLVFATGTLALGIHMPCKTVVIVGHSRYLNSLEFQQMSGRAGRRGFDTVGNVVFMGLNEEKIRSLLTGDLPKMIGSFPLSVSLVLRVLLMVSSMTSDGTHSEKVTNDALSRYVHFYATVDLKRVSAY
jgi:hypothetical protein